MQLRQGLRLRRSAGAAASPYGSAGDGPVSKPAPAVTVRIQLLTYLWTESLSVSGAIVWGPPSLPCHVGLFRSAHDRAAGLIRVSREGARESACKAEVTVVCNLTSEMTSHHVCPVLRLRSRRWIQPTVKGGYYTRLQKQKTGGPLGTVLTTLSFKMKIYLLIYFGCTWDLSPWTGGVTRHYPRSGSMESLPLG